MAQIHTKLKYVVSPGQSLVSDQIQSNIIDFFQYGLLEAGHFQNVYVAQSGANGDFSKLYPVEDSRFVDGQVWQAARKNWVYESGLDYQVQPIQISGVYVNGTFHPLSGVGTYSHYIDYPNGRVVFNSPITTTATVKAEYSTRLVEIESVDCPTFRNALTNSFNANSPQLNWIGSGNWGINGENRVQFPAVFVEVPPRRSFTGKELGGGHVVLTDVLFYVVAENSWDRNRLIDIISCQIDKELYFYDKNKTPPQLDPNTGSIYSGCILYPNLVQLGSDYLWQKCSILGSRVEGEAQIDLGQFTGIVRLTTELRTNEF